MQMKIVLSTIGIFIVSLIFFIVSIGYYNDKTSKMTEAHEQNKILKSQVSSSEKDKQQNSVLINKIKNDPNKLAKDAKHQATKLIDVLKKTENYSDGDKKKVFKSELKNFTSDSVRSSDELTSITVPKDYDVDVSTQRGYSIPILVSSKDRYLVIEYDSYSEQIISVKEYKKS